MHPVTTAAVLRQLSLGLRSVSELSQSFGVSEATISRMLRGLEAERRIVRIGKTRGARYASFRHIGDALGSQWPLYRVDESGAAHEMGTVLALDPDSYFVTGGPTQIQELTDGIPYFLEDARPDGFLGRAVPFLFPDLGLPPRVADWTDDHFIVYLTRRGDDTPGALIVGAEAMDRHLSRQHASPVVTAQSRASKYPEYAAAAMAGAPPGSSAQGEHPKFAVSVEEEGPRASVLVKFSPPTSTLVGQRWADLLTAEHLAHRVLQEHGIAACRSALYEHSDRVFLESERFDRVGAQGRRATVSLFAVDASFYGRLDSWTAAAGRLAADTLLSAEDADRIRLLDVFGALIANTDRHFGNITFFDTYEGPFRLAPVYDMLPMLFAPQNEQLVERHFQPPAQTAAWLTVWSRARALAQVYWERLIEEPRLTPEFRTVCQGNLAALVQAHP